VQDKLDQKFKVDFAKKALKLKDDPDSDVSYFASNYT
jgi:hypothetical protein